jgi:hypothetical protein
METTLQGVVRMRAGLADHRIVLLPLLTVEVWVTIATENQMTAIVRLRSMRRTTRED